MKAWDQFFPLVVPHVLGAPDPLVEQAICLAAREFCEKTSAWKEWMDPFTADGTTNRFEHDLSNAQELVKTLRCTVNGEDYTVKAQRDLPADWQTSTDGLCNTLVHLDNREYLLFKQPVAGDIVLIQIAIKPALTAPSVDDVVFERYAEAIAHGAKARLMVTPKQTFTDLVLGGYHETKFEAAIHAAANDDFKKGPRRVKPSAL